MDTLKEKAWLEWLETMDPFSVGYLSCESQHHTIRLACAMRDYWAKMPAIINQDDLLVGRMGARGIGSFSYGSGIFCDARLAEKLRQEYPQWQNHLDMLVEFWVNMTPGSRISHPENERFMGGQNVYWLVGAVMLCLDLSRY